MCNFVVGHVYCMYKENLQVKKAIRFVLSVDQLVTNFKPDPFVMYSFFNVVFQCKLYFGNNICKMIY